MSVFSNLLRQRLASGPGGGARPDSHPDADTLTAYTEQLLPAAERGQVLEHLAACSHCRDVVAFSLPEPVANVAAAPGAATKGRRWGFLWSPRFRVATSLATVVIVAMVLLQIRQKPTESGWKQGSAAPATTGRLDNDKDKDNRKDSGPSAEIARAEVPAQPPVRAFAGGNTADVNSNRAREAWSPADNKTSLASARNSAVANSNVPVLTERTAVSSRNQRNDYVNSDFFANNASPEGAAGSVTVSGAAGELPVAPMPRTSHQFPPVTINPANTMPLAEVPAAATGTPAVHSIAPPPGKSRWMTTLSAVVPTAKKALTRSSAPAIPPGASTSFAMGGAGLLNPRTQPSEAAAAAPALDSGVSGLELSGALRGRALADASINARAEMREGAPNSWRISGGRLVRPGESGKWVDACPGSEAMEFTAFAAHGNDIWAGGNSAVLMHSRDGGATCEWPTLGASATGAITRIEVRGATVQVKSSSGQSWSSQDGGKTWKMDE